MEPDKFSEWLGILAQVGAGCGAVAGFVVLFWRKLQAGWAGCRAAIGLHVHFGDQAAGKIKAMLDDLQRSQSTAEIRQRLAEHHLKLGLYICSPDGACTWANDVLCESFGMSNAEMLGYGWLGAIVEADRMRTHKLWTDSVAYGVPYTAHYTVENKRTGHKWAAKTEAVTVMDRGQIVAYVGWLTEC